MACESSGSATRCANLERKHPREKPRRSRRRQRKPPKRKTAALPLRLLLPARPANPLQNYFNYFTEIEEHYLRRLGAGLLLSTLDWALIETWKDAGIPLEAALRGINAAFDRYDQRPTRTKKVNSLAYCSQEVLAAAEEMKEAAVGVAGADPGPSRETRGFEPGVVAAFLRRNADLLDTAKLPQSGPVLLRTVASEASKTLRQFAAETEAKPSGRLEDLERRLTVLEEKLFAALLAATPDEQIVTVRAEADLDLAPYRRKMSGPQIEQLHKQYVNKRLLE